MLIQFLKSSSSSFSSSKIYFVLFVLFVLETLFVPVTGGGDGPVNF